LIVDKSLEAEQLVLSAGKEMGLIGNRSKVIKFVAPFVS